MDGGKRVAHKCHNFTFFYKTEDLSRKIRIFAHKLQLLAHHIESYLFVAFGREEGFRFIYFYNNSASIIYMDINFDIDIIGGFDPEKDKWDALIEAAMAGNVVPVIGPDIICEYNDGLNINEIIISSIAKQLRLSGSHKTFSQLVYDTEFLGNLKKLLHNDSLTKDVIYALVNNLFNNTKNLGQYFKPSAALKKLLNIKLFPFVITTSFSPVVENAMREAWGNRKVNVLSFCHNPQKDTKPGVGDISAAEDMTNPTVYYMFGKTTTQPHSYVLTDNDMLEFCQYWLSDQTRPRNLCAQLKDKYLLMLGCGYSDWLFRFIWFCMNKTADAKTKGLMAQNQSTHETLVEYLRRIDTFLPENKTPEEIIDEIDKRITQHTQSHQDELFARPPRTSTQVFISYSRRDSVVAETLYRYLTHNGLSVWYDRNDLLGGANFMDEIDLAIENCKVFVPIFSHNIAREAMDAHVYRREWKKAISLQESMGSRTFIVPINEDDFDIQSADIPQVMKDLNSIAYGPALNFEPVLASINEALNRLDNFHNHGI